MVIANQVAPSSGAHALLSVAQRALASLGVLGRRDVPGPGGGGQAAAATLTAAAPVSVPAPAGAMTLADAVLMLALAAGVVRVLGPTRSALAAAREKGLSAKELSGQLLPHYLLFGQCSFWAFFGFYASLPDVLRFNALSAGMCVACLLLVASGAQEARQHLHLIIGAAVCFVLVLSAGIAVISQQASSAGPAAPQQAFAWLAVLCSVLQCTVPLVQAASLRRSRRFWGSGGGRAAAAATAASVALSLLWAEYSFVAAAQLSIRAGLAGCAVGGVLVAIVAWGSHAASAEDAGDARLDADPRPLMPRAGRKLKGLPLHDCYAAFEGRAWRGDVAWKPDADRRRGSEHDGAPALCVEDDGGEVAKSPFTPLQAVDLDDEPECEAPCGHREEDGRERGNVSPWARPPLRAAPGPRAAPECRL